MSKLHLKNCDNYWFWAQYWKQIILSSLENLLKIDRLKMSSILHLAYIVQNLNEVNFLTQKTGRSFFKIGRFISLKLVKLQKSLNIFN